MRLFPSDAFALEEERELFQRGFLRSLAVIIRQHDKIADSAGRSEKSRLTYLDTSDFGR